MSQIRAPRDICATKSRGSIRPVSKLLHQAAGREALGDLRRGIRAKPFQRTVTALKIEIYQHPAEIENDGFVHVLLTVFRQRDDRNSLKSCFSLACESLSM